MFTDESLEPVEYKSSWKKERYVTDHGCQTRDLPVNEVACQSVKRRHKEVQTEEEVLPEFELMDDNLGRLQDFLCEHVPYLMKQLQRNCRSHAFDGYDVNLDEDEEAVAVTHTLTNAALDQQLQITGLSWNSTGSVLAASFGRFDHEDWCTHKSTLCTWNLDRRNLDERKANTTIDVSSCLMCIECHPKQPAMIAGGTFNGEVVVWDTSKEDEMLAATSGIGDDSHREPVTKVTWVLDPDSKGKKYLVISTSSDGKILVWQPDFHKQTLKLIDGFILLTESLPRHIRVRAKRSDQEMGVTCISFNHDDISTFLIGSESGGIFKCSADARGTPAGANIESSIQLRSPVTFCYEPHQGPVHSVQWSPYHRNLFISSSMDGCIRIYSLLQAAPILSMEPGQGYLYSTRWSPVRPLVFSVCTEAGKLLVYDMKHSRSAPYKTMEANEKRTPLYTMQFNHKQQHLLATGDGLGYIKVWKLGEELATQGNKETDVLDEMANSVME